MADDWRVTVTLQDAVRAWKYLIVGADNEDDAGALAETVRQHASADASVQVEGSPSVDTRPLVTGEVASLFFYL